MKPEPKKATFDLLGYLGMRPKKIEEKYKKYASLNRRMFAATIDSVIATLTVSPAVDWILQNTIPVRDVSLELNKIITQDVDLKVKILELIKIFIDSGRMSEFIAQMGALLLASAICWKFWSATPGKMLLRMKIVDADTEQPMTDEQIILRNLGYIPSLGFFLLGIIWISFNKKRQGLHDKIANTVVIIVPRKKAEPVADKE